MGFAAGPALEPRFGDATLLILGMVLGATVAAIVYVAAKLTAAQPAGTLAPDVLALALFVPILAAVSDVQVAGERPGSQNGYFFMAAIAALCVLGLVELVAALGNADRPLSIAVGAVPAALCIAVVLGGVERYSAGAITDGLSIAWMLAAAVTLVSGLLRFTPTGIMVGAYALIAAVVLIVSRGSATTEISGGNRAIAFLVTLAAGASLAAMPRVARLVAGAPMRPIDVPDSD